VGGDDVRLARTLFPADDHRRLAATALVISFAVEVSQLYHAEWIDGIRETRLGALTLGSGFLWSDLVCYTLGSSLPL